MNQNNATNKIATQIREREIVITRVFDAPRDPVFDAWTKEEHLSKWWGPQGFTTTFQKFDINRAVHGSLSCTVLMALIIPAPTSLSCW